MKLKLRLNIALLVGALAVNAASTPAFAGPKVLVCFGDSPTIGQSVVTLLAQTNAFDSVTALDCTQNTPTLATLVQYQAVLMWDNNPYMDRAGLGNVMADYVDAGGGVVQGMFNLFANFELLGRWSGYNCLLPSPNVQVDSLAAMPNDPQSDLVQGVKTLNSNNAGQAKLAAGAVSVWDWKQNRTPAVATCAPGGHSRVDLAFYPSPQNWTGDAVALLKNALLHVSGGFNPLKGTPSSLAFPDTAVGGISTPLTVTYTNSDKAPLTVTALTIGGPAAAAYAIVSQPRLPIIVPPGGTLAVDLTFAPTANGPQTAKVSAVVTGQMGTADVGLLGAGVLSKIRITPVPINFGGAQVGTPVTTTITITNTGTDRIAVSSLSPSDPAFTVVTSPDLPVVLAGGGSFTVTLQFLPTGNGLTRGTLTVASTDPTAPSLLLAMSGFSGPPMVLLDTGTLLFASVNLGARSAEQSVGIQNTGFSDLIVTSIQPGGANAGDFAIAMVPLPATVHAQTTLKVGVSFVPTVVGSRSGNLTIATSDANQPTVRAVFLGTATQTTAQVAPTMLDFGTNRVGMAGPTKTVGVTSTGGGTLKVSALTLGGNDPGAFAVVSGAAPFQVAGMATSKVGFACKPTPIGALTATATLVTDLGMQVIQLTCSGTSPRTVVAPNLMDFGNVKVNDISAKTPLTITNTGTDDLNVSTFDIGGPDDSSFEVVDAPAQLPATIKAGQSLTVNLVFKPVRGGGHEAMLSLATDDPLLARSVVPLTGNGTQASIQVKPVSVNFGPIPIGSTSPSTAVTIQNSGSTTLSSVMVALGGMNATLFNLDQRGPFTIAPGQSIAVNVSYSPPSVGGARGTLIVSATGLPATNVTLFGSGTSPTLSVDVPGPAMAAGLAFGNVIVGQTSSPQIVTIHNNGTAPVQLGGVTASDAAFVVDTSATTMVLAPKAATTFAVTFQPSAAKATRGQIAILLNNVKTPIATVNAAGTGVAPTKTTTGGCATGSPSTPGLAWPLGVLLISGLLVGRRRRHH